MEEKGVRIVIAQDGEYCNNIHVDDVGVCRWDLLYRTRHPYHSRRQAKCNVIRGGFGTQYHHEITAIKFPE
jgi:hypothetical protein